MVLEVSNYKEFSMVTIYRSILDIPVKYNSDKNR